MATEPRRLSDHPGLTALVERPIDPSTIHLFDVEGILRELQRPGIVRRPLYDAAKRAFDITTSLVALLLTLPLLAVIALLIKLDSPGPVLFRQERLGKDGKRFTMVKFRSMYVDCEVITPELAQRNESTGPLFKMRNDPRITRVGRFLRRTSLDELPQILNVLEGSMSIVGPRPPLPRELAGYEDLQQQRLQVKPGLAGLWQVSGRSNLTFDEMVALDLEYIERRSFWFDLQLIVRTIPCVLLGRGAY